MLKEIVLQPEQRKIVEFSPINPISIKGVAGSGKTTVALYRAAYLVKQHCDMFSENSVIIFTYNKLLSNYIERLTDEMGLNVKVRNFHRWAYNFIMENNIADDINIADNKTCKRILNTVLTKNITFELRLPIVMPSNFLLEEFSWIKGKNLRDKQEYIDVSRLGRGREMKLSTEMKSNFWDIYEAYNTELRDSGYYDFDDFALIIIDYLSDNPDFVPPYTHIVVDEAQDFTMAQMLVIKKIVSPATNSITVIADSAQKIYKSGFKWSEVDMDFTGRGRTLKNNYRSTVNIAKAAQSLLANDDSDEVYTKITSARQGKHTPVVANMKTAYEQDVFLHSILDEVNKDYTVVILHRQRKSLDEICKKLNLAGYDDCYILNANERNFPKKRIYISTLSAIKGLEFDVVIVLDCNNGTLPLCMSQRDDELQEATDRRLLYTAMTRAREQLYLISSSSPSQYLTEIDSSTVEIIEK